MRVVSFVKSIGVTSTYTLELSGLISLSYCVLSITSDGYRSVEFYSFVSYKTGIWSLIKTLDSGSIPLGKIYSLFDELQYFMVGKLMIVLLLT